MGKEGMTIAKLDEREWMRLNVAQAVSLKSALTPKWFDIVL
jgi:hypothetical protein